MALEDNYHALFSAAYIFYIFVFNLFQALFRKHLTEAHFLIWENNANDVINFDNVINFVRDAFVKRIFCV